MSSVSVISSAIISESRRADTRLEKDFKVWLASLQSGNPSATLAAFTALKNDFQKSSQLPPAKLLHRPKRRSSSPN